MFRMKKRSIAILISALLLMSSLGPSTTFAAAAKLQYTGWLPFWEEQRGALDTALHLNQLTSVSPFSYEVTSGGKKLSDSIGIHSGLWPGWLSAVHDGGVKIIPTIAWFDGAGIHATLSNGPKRRAQEDLIAKLVMDEHFDGIDIDYEAKLAKTIDYFSTFLYGLALRLHPKGKILSCTIESRTPLSSLYLDTIPDDIEYANDYAALNKYCDEVRIMAYDQGLVDRKLRVQKGNGRLYAPVADTAWVEKVVAQAVKTINPKKIMLGVPTYGYEWEVTWANGISTYRRLRSVNFFTAMNVADREGIAPLRNNAGELGFAYRSSTLIEVSRALRWDVTSTFPVEFATLGIGGPGEVPPELAQISIAWPGGSAKDAVVRYISFPDAASVAEKVALAKKYGLKGIALFKLDGGFDPLIWEVMK